MQTKALVYVLAIVMAVLPLQRSLAAVPYKIVTASERGTYIEIGRDLAKFVAPAVAQQPLRDWHRRVYEIPLGELQQWPKRSRSAQAPPDTRHVDRRAGTTLPVAKRSP